MIYTIIEVAAGILLVYIGCRRILMLRQIQNTPISRVDMGAVGSYVKIKGKIQCEEDQILKAPLSKIPCAFYDLVIKKNRGPYANPYDRILSRDHFSLIDESGTKVLVSLNEAKIGQEGKGGKLTIDGFKKKIYSDRDYDNIPESLRQAIKGDVGSFKNFVLVPGLKISNQKIIIREWFLAPNEEVYVTGFADSLNSSPELIAKKYPCLS